MIIRESDSELRGNIRELSIAEVTDIVNVKPTMLFCWNGDFKDNEPVFQHTVFAVMTGKIVNFPFCVLINVGDGMLENDNFQHVGILNDTKQH